MYSSIGKVIEVKDSRAIVEIDGKKRAYPVREDVQIRKGDRVVVILNTVVGKE